MNLAARRVLFFIFVLFFFIAAPVSVLYTAGYRYNARAGSIVRTGVLSIATTPRGAMIELNDKELKKTTPHIVKQAIPGPYTVEINKEEYLPWSGTVDVETGETTFLDTILLFRDAEPTRIQQHLAQNAAISPTGEFVATVTRVNNELQLWVTTVRDRRTTIVQTFPLSDDTYTITWSHDGSLLLIENSNQAFVYKPTGEAVDIPQTIQSVYKRFWHPTDGHILYLQSNTYLQKIDFEQSTSETISSDTEFLLESSQKTFIFRDNGTQVELRSLSTTETSELIALLPRGSYSINIQDDPFLLISNDRGIFYLIDTAASSPIVLERHGTLFDWNASNNSLVYSDGHEVTAYFTQSDLVTFITRQGEPITDIAWHPSGNHILLSTETSIDALEVFPTAKLRYRTHLVQHFAEITDMYLSSDGKTLYLVGRATDEETTTAYRRRLR